MKKKLYAIESKSDDKFYFSGDRVIPNWSDNLIRHFRNCETVKEIAEENNGNVVTLIKEPEKVTLTKEQAEIVEHAHVHVMPACYISEQPDDEELLMNAYVNGYTVENEKKYNVKVPHTKDIWYFKASKAYLLTICPADDKKLRGKFTLTDIEHYGLQDCEKEECD